MKLKCTIEEIELENDYGDSVEGVSATCLGADTKPRVMGLARRPDCGAA